MRLGKEIYNLQRRMNKRQSNGAIFEMMTSKMTIDLNVLSALIKTELWAIWIELWLSQYIGVGWEKDILISTSNQRNQTISLVVDVMARYSASVDDSETIDCFLLFQEIRESPKKIQNPVTDLRSVGSLPWSASEYARNSREEVDESNRLWKTIPRRYRKIRRTAAQWTVVGEATN